MGSEDSNSSEEKNQHKRRQIPTFPLTASGQVSETSKKFPGVRSLGIHVFFSELQKRELGNKQSIPPPRKLKKKNCRFSISVAPGYSP